MLLVCSACHAALDLRSYRVFSASLPGLIGNLSLEPNHVLTMDARVNPRIESGDGHDESELAPSGVILSARAFPPCRDRTTMSLERLAYSAASWGASRICPNKRSSARP